MSTATVTRLAFVRTASGVVRVEKGGAVPADALEAEVERLVTAGVITTSDDDQDSGQALGGSGDPAPTGDSPRGEKPRGRSSGSSPKAD